MVASGVGSTFMVSDVIPITNPEQIDGVPEVLIPVKVTTC